MLRVGPAVWIYFAEVGPSAGARGDLKGAELEAVLAEWTVGAVGAYATWTHPSRGVKGLSLSMICPVEVKLLGIGTCRQLQTLLRRWRIVALRHVASCGSSSKPPLSGLSEAPGTSAAPKWSLQALQAAPTLLGGSMPLGCRQKRNNKRRCAAAAELERISLGCGTLGMAGGGPWESLRFHQGQLHVNNTVSEASSVPFVVSFLLC